MRQCALKRQASSSSTRTAEAQAFDYESRARSIKTKLSRFLYSASDWFRLNYLQHLSKLPVAPSHEFSHKNFFYTSGNSAMAMMNLSTDSCPSHSSTSFGNLFFGDLGRVFSAPNFFEIAGRIKGSRAQNCRKIVPKKMN